MAGQEEDKNNVHVVIRDDLGNITVKRQKEQLLKEKELFEKNIENSDKDLANFLPQWEIDKRHYELLLEGNNMLPVEPKLHIEKLDEYWAIRKKKVEYEFRHQTALAEGQIKKFKMERELAEKELERVLKNLAKYEVTQ